MEGVIPGDASPPPQTAAPVPSSAALPSSPPRPTTSKKTHHPHHHPHHHHLHAVGACLQQVHARQISLEQSTMEPFLRRPSPTATTTTTTMASARRRHRLPAEDGSPHHHHHHHHHHRHHDEEEEEEGEEGSESESENESDEDEDEDTGDGNGDEEGSEGISSSDGKRTTRSRRRPRSMASLSLHTQSLASQARPQSCAVATAAYAGESDPAKPLAHSTSILMSSPTTGELMLSPKWRKSEQANGAARGSPHAWLGAKRAEGWRSTDGIEIPIRAAVTQKALMQSEGDPDQADEVRFSDEDESDLDSDDTESSVEDSNSTDTSDLDHDDEELSEDIDVDENEAAQVADVKFTFLSISLPAGQAPPGSNESKSPVRPVGPSPLGDKLQKRRNLREHSNIFSTSCLYLSDIVRTHGLEEKEGYRPRIYSMLAERKPTDNHLPFVKEKPAVGVDQSSNALRTSLEISASKEDPDDINDYSSLTMSTSSSNDLEQEPADQLAEKKGTEFISEKVDRLFQGETLDREDLEHMASLFRTKWARRCFSESLNRARARENSVGSGWSDTEVQDFVQNTLQRSGKVDIWRNELFWEEIYYDAVMEEREKSIIDKPWNKFTPEEQADIIAKEKNFIFGQLGSYSCTMLSFGVPTEKAREFIERHCAINSLPQEQIDMLLSNLDPLAGSFSVEEEERENKLRKAEWLSKNKEEWAKRREKRLQMPREPTKPLKREGPSPAHRPGALTHPGITKPVVRKKRPAASSLATEATGESGDALQSSKSGVVRRKTRIAELLFKPSLSIFHNTEKSSRTDSTSPPNSPSGASESPFASERSRTPTVTSPRKVASLKGSDDGRKQQAIRRARKEVPATALWVVHSARNAPPQGNNPQQGAPRKELPAPPGFTPMELRTQVRRLEELINIYEMHFSSRALATMIYPSLCPADIPPPHGKIGWLQKLVGRVKKTWRRKLFIIKHDFLFCYSDIASITPDKVVRLHQDMPIRALELYLTSVKKGGKEAAGGKEKDLNSCYPFTLEIPIATPANLRSSRGGRRGPKSLLVHAESEENQRDWFYCLKRAATTKWYKDTSLELPLITSSSNE